MKKNEAGQVVAFQAVSATDGSAVTTGTPTVYVTIDGGTQATGTNTAIHEGQGTWSYVPTQAETNGDHIVFTFTLSGSINQAVNVYPVTVSEYQADVSGLSTFDPATDAVANVTTVATCTTNSDMRGTNDALLSSSAPANFSALSINASGHISRVTLVDTTTVNSDMVDLTDLQVTVDDTNADLEAFISTTTTNFANLDGKITTVDGIVDAILLDTDELQSKIIPMLVLDGATYQYTVNALENAPSGGGGDATSANQTTIINTLSDMSGATFDTATDSLEAISDATGGSGTTAANLIAF